MSYSIMIYNVGQEVAEEYQVETNREVLDVLDTSLDFITSRVYKSDMWTTIWYESDSSTDMWGNELSYNKVASETFHHPVFGNCVVVTEV